MSENKYGCFTTVRAERLPGGGVGVHGWARHIERLQRDTTDLFGTPVCAEAIVAAFADAIAAATIPLPCLVRLAVENADLQITPTTRALTAASRPLRVRVARHDRMRPTIKHTATAPEFALRDAALEAGYDDAVMLSADGTLTEGTTWSLVLGRPDGTWVTPATRVLPSVTVALVAEAVPMTFAEVSVDDLGQFTSAAALSSGRGVHPIASIGEVAFTGSVDVLRQAYAGARIEPVLPA